MFLKPKGNEVCSSTRTLSRFTAISSTDAIKNPHENPSGRSRVAACERTNMTKPAVTFRGFAQAPK